MKKILINSKVALRAGLIGIQNASIYISPDTDFLPQAVKLPAIGIKDGSITHTPKNMGSESQYEVSFCIFLEIRKDEASIIGDESQNRKGVLDIAEDVKKILDDNMMEIPYMLKAFCIGESEIVAGVRENNSEIMRKILTYEYTKVR